MEQLSTAITTIIKSEFDTDQAPILSRPEPQFGDYTTNVAMQLAKPLGRKPRELAEQLSAALFAMPAFAQWVEAIEIAGPGFLNIRLKTAAKQQIVREVLAAGDTFGRQPARGGIERRQVEGPADSSTIDRFLVDVFDLEIL